MVCRPGVDRRSLAGLFALYAIYQTDLFSRVEHVRLSLVSSMKEYIFSHEPKQWPDCMYFLEIRRQDPKPILQKRPPEHGRYPILSSGQGIILVFQRSEPWEPLRP